MKKRLNLNSLWLSVLSGAALILLFVIGTGTDYMGFGIAGLSDYDQFSTYEDGEYKRRSENSWSGDYNVWTGTKDPQGRWHGQTRIEVGNTGGSSSGDKPYTVETVTYVDGMRHGKSIKSYTSPDIPDEEICYRMGKVVPCENPDPSGKSTASASGLLLEQYPWYVDMFRVRGFEDAFITAFVDTLEMILFDMEYAGGLFINYYDIALDSIYETRFDTLMSANSSISFFFGQEEMLNAQFRLAVLDHSREEGSSTFEVVNLKYPGYLEVMDSLEISAQEFEAFCGDLDSLMSTYSPLDENDPFFTDSVDSHLSRALMFIGSYEEDTAEVSASLKSAPLLSSRTALRESLHSVLLSRTGHAITPRSSEIASSVFYTILMQFYEGDKVMAVLEESFNGHHSIVSVPVVSTEYLGGVTSSSAEISGYIHDDGGGAVAVSGVAWATHFNPTTENQTVQSGATEGSYVVTLEGLTEGETYYARSYATNSAGTAYGNCVEFVVQSTVGTGTPEAAPVFSIYPNPASETATFRIQAKTLNQPQLSIINLKGQEVLRRELGGPLAGSRRIEIDLSDLESGIYHCRLSDGGKVIGTRKLVIAP